MKKLALSSAIALALGVSAAAYADRGHNDPSLVIDDSFNSTSKYSLDLTKTYTQNVDMDYRTTNTIDIGVAVAASVLTGTVSGNQVNGAPGGLALDDIAVHTYGKASNSIDGSHTTGISAVSQSIGNNSLNQQSAVVQANFHM